MTWIGKNLIVDSLRELSSQTLQERLWFATDTEVSSFTEAVAQLFNDSGLVDALAKNETGFSEDVNNKLRELDALLLKIDANRAPSDIVSDPAMPLVRAKAAEILKLIQD